MENRAAAWYNPSKIEPGVKRMDTEKVFLTILKSALLGEAPRLEEELPPGEWEQLFQIARIHKILPLFYDAVYGLPSLQGASQLKAQVRHQVVGQTIRTGEFLALNRRLQEAGVKPLVVKGIVCRSLYPKPDLRPSADEDVLIRPQDFETCRRVMEEMGTTTELDPEQQENAYEVPYRKAGGMLYIELHRSLFPPESQAYGNLTGFFDGVLDREVALEIQGSTVWTMAPTDHLFYLICHAFKHFLHSGFGIRQVCDIVMFANHYGPEIDWQQVLDNCRRIRGEKFAAAIFRIGEKYLVFDPVQAAWPQTWQEISVDEKPLLEDLLSGGVYGDATMSRKHSSSITLDAVAAQKEGKKKKNSLLLSAFPPAKKLEGRYPWLKQRPWLLPVAWVSRMAAYSAELGRTKENSAADALKIGDERIALMKEYGILE